MLKKLLLIDCYGFFYKAHFAFLSNPLRNRKGQVTSVIFAFFGFLRRLLAERNSHLLLCILDSKGPTHRHKKDPNYKLNRPPMPEELSQQVKAIRELLPLIGLPLLEKAGYEADDLIAKYAREARGLGFQVEIFSSDKDLYQLVNDTTKLVLMDRRNKNYEEIDAEKVKIKFKVRPRQIADLLALMGDSSDNVPGVAGIGAVLGAKLLSAYGNLEALYEAVEKTPKDFSAALLKKLSEGKKVAFLSRELVTLEQEIPHLPALGEIEEQAVEQAALLKAFTGYECFSLIKEFGLSPSQGEAGEKTIRQLMQKKEEQQGSFLAPSLTASSAPAKGAEVVVKPPLTPFERQEIVRPWEEKQLHPLLKQLAQSQAFTFDLETTSLDPYVARVVAIVFAFSGQKSFYLRLVEEKDGALADHSQAVLTQLKPFFEAEELKKIGHNLKFEYSILKQQGITLRGMGHDTMLYEYLLSADRNRFKLENLIWDYFQFEKKSYKALTKDTTELLSVSPQALKTYTFEDGEFTQRLFEAQQGRLDEKQAALLHTLELPLIEVLAEMELAGVHLEVGLLRQLSERLHGQLALEKEKIYSLVGEHFNINSTKQLQQILFEKLKLKPIKKTKTGFSTDNFVLEQLAREHEVAQVLLEYRRHAKLLSTYLDALPGLLHPKTGKLHTSYNQFVTATGRLSSNNPNLQNIPIGTESEGIRRAFIAPPGFKVVSIDYSQVELRVLAFLSKDELLLEAYAKKQDIHRHTASLIFGKPMEEVTASERSRAKTINFALLYGSSAFSLGKTLSISTSQAQSFIDSYFKSYQGVRRYLKAVLEKARHQGWVATYYGRRRRVPDLGAKNFSLRTRAERIAFNTIIQGTASDLIKFAMVNLHRKFKSGSLAGQMVMQVHDELVFYICEKKVASLLPLLERELIAIKPFDTILAVNSTVGDCWEK